MKTKFIIIGTTYVLNNGIVSYQQIKYTNIKMEFSFRNVLDINTFFLMFK